MYKYNVSNHYSNPFSNYEHRITMVSKKVLFAVISAAETQ